MTILSLLIFFPNISIGIPGDFMINSWLCLGYNLIGNDILVYRGKKYSNDEFFFDYLKKEIKPKRKMGHLTVIKKII